MKRIATVAAALSTVLCTVVAAVSVAGASATQYVVIVHPANRHGSLNRTFLADAFLKKATRWSNGKAIYAADLEYESDTRDEFSEEVIRRSVSAVRAYWQQRIFGGLDVPPPQFERESDVVDYVLKNEGAVGYVSPSTELRGAQVVAVTE